MNDDNLTDVQRIALKLSKRLAEEGLLIKAGFYGYLMMAYPDRELPAVQRLALEQSFLAGAYHLFSSLMNTLDPDAEPTEQDVRRLDKIHTELECYRKELTTRAAMHMRTRGNA